MNVTTACVLNDGKPMSTLNILLVSDTHYGLKQLDALMAATQDQTFDFIVHSGDIIDIPMEHMDAAPDVEAERCQQVHEVIAKLTACAKGAPVYYIPGNHDPTSMFTGWSAIGGKTAMVHKETWRVTSDLVLMGFGGSVPGYQNGQQVWNAVPFKSNEAMKLELEPLLAGVRAERCSSDPACLRPEDGVLLVTHVGPHGSDTAIDSYCHGTVQSPVHGGSTYLGEAMMDPVLQDAFVLNVHGHTHVGYGSRRFGEIPVINPGSLKENRYARVELRKSVAGRWQVESMLFLTLPSL